MSEPLNSSFPAQLLFLVCFSVRNVLWEVVNTSETKQEEGDILTFAAESLTRIRSANASQTKSVLFMRSTRILSLADSQYMINPGLHLLSTNKIHIVC